MVISARCQVRGMGYEEMRDCRCSAIDETWRSLASILIGGSDKTSCNHGVVISEAASVGTIATKASYALAVQRVDRLLLMTEVSTRRDYLLKKSPNSDADFRRDDQTLFLRPCKSLSISI